MTDANPLPQQDPEPALATPPPLSRSAPHHSVSWWLRRLLVCNPFYLVSAALLLYGFYRVSSDTGFLHRETAQLAFNLSSLQIYELLLVGTAVFLARRCVWYDSTLLVCLENLLVLVPFILITQAALIELRLVWLLSLGAAVLALARIGGLRRGIARLNFPPRLVWVGLALLGANAVLPVVYRALENSRIGVHPDFGAAYYTHQCAWLLLLPGLCALANLLPLGLGPGALRPHNGWLPLGWFVLWLTGTVVHLYCLGYIYELDLSAPMTAPAIWVLLWTVQRRAAPWLEWQTSAWQGAALAAPVLATWLGVSEPGNRVFLVLTLANVVAYGTLWVRGGKGALAPALVLVSVMGLVGGFPADWGVRLVADFNRGAAVAAALAGGLLLWAAGSRSPKAALGAALVVGLFLLVLLSHRADVLHWALEAALVVVLLHSLRWRDAEHVGAEALRVIAATVWVVDAGFWMHTGGAAWSVCALAAPVLGAYVATGWFTGRWGRLAVPVAAGLVLLSGPGSSTADKLQSLPAGLLAVVGSFVLFGLGTWLAVSRRKWLN